MILVHYGLPTWSAVLQVDQEEVSKMIDTAALLGKVAWSAYRANEVRSDPAVVKAAKQSWEDITQACRSTSDLVSEVRASFNRSAGTSGPERGPRARRERQ